jgi:hypothetical protein
MKYILLSLVMLAIVACKKKDEAIILSQHLPGTWDFKSLKLDEEEFVGYKIESGFIRFEDHNGTSGLFHQEVKFINSSTDTLKGTYTLLDDPGKVQLLSATKSNMVTIKINPKDALVWEGDQEGKKVVLKANRRT